MNKRVHVTTLGCSKNTVDSEVLMGQLETNHFEIIDQPEAADVIIINTCGFIQDAKEESIQAIFEALKLKEDDPAKKVFVAGCLTQRYKKEIEKEIPEVDAIFGTEDYQGILNALGKQHAAADNLQRMRKVSTPRHYAYLKISEGCNHTCAFCAIPAIRGRHRSRSMDSLLDEARKLAAGGARELVLISQDTSYYGKDLYGKQMIVPLLEQLHDVPGLRWIRVMYWYPTLFPKEVLNLISSSDKLLPYIDMPIQHISHRMLRLMRRGDTRDSLLSLFSEMRERIPEIALRTTLIVGHPGETEEDFAELLSFVRDLKFDRLGSFIYSDEDQTRAFHLPDKVDAETAGKRQDLLMAVQREISLQNNRALVGQTIPVLLDEFNPDTGMFGGRTWRDAPEVDNEVIVPAPDSSHNCNIGDFVKVKIEDASEYELYAKILEPGS